jgi:hypothetical protein
MADSGLDGAEVRLSAVGVEAGSRAARPGPGGTFEFDGVTPGSYVLSVRRIGYFRVADTLRVTPDSGAAAVAVLARDHAVLDGCGYAYVPVRLPWWRPW